MQFMCSMPEGIQYGTRLRITCRYSRIRNNSRLPPPSHRQDNRGTASHRPFESTVLVFVFASNQVHSSSPSLGSYISSLHRPTRAQGIRN